METRFSIDTIGIDDFWTLNIEQHEAAIAIYNERIDAASGTGDEYEVTKLYGLRRMHLERLADLLTDHFQPTMPKLPISLYTSAASVPAFQSFTDLLGENLDQPVDLKPLDELPAPDQTRKQRLRLELAGLQELRDTVLHCIQVGETDPARFASDLVSMRCDRDQYEFRIEAIEQQLMKGGQSNG